MNKSFGHVSCLDKGPPIFELPTITENPRVHPPPSLSPIPINRTWDIEQFRISPPLYMDRETWKISELLYPYIRGNIKKCVENMKKYVESMKKYQENMKKYVGIVRNM